MYENTQEKTLYALSDTESAIHEDRHLLLQPTPVEAQGHRLCLCLVVHLWKLPARSRGEGLSMKRSGLLVGISILSPKKAVKKAVIQAVFEP